MVKELIVAKTGKYKNRQITPGGPQFGPVLLGLISALVQLFSARLSCFQLKLAYCQLLSAQTEQGLY